MTALPALRRNSSSGTLCLIVGIAVFSLQDLILKLISGDYPLSQAMVLRSLTAMPILFAFTLRDGGAGTLLTPGTKAMIARGVVMLIAYTTYYLALPALPIATTVALYFSAPLFITVLSVLMLSERVSALRWLAVMVGFGGVLIMVDPGDDLFDWAAILPVICGMTYGLSMIFARQLGTTETASALAFWGNAVFLVGSVMMSLLFSQSDTQDMHPSLAFLLRPWVWPSLVDGLMMCGCGVIAAIGLTLLTQAYRIAEANVVAPFEYTAMIWGVLWGWVFWQDWPDAMGWIGIAVIVSAGLFVLWRERVERKD